MDSATQELVRRRANERCNTAASGNPVSRLAFMSNTSSPDSTEEPTIPLTWLWPVIGATFKGPNLSAIDTESGNILSLFHPRKDIWQSHFILEQGLIRGTSEMGRATARLLNMNAYHRVQLRIEIEKQS